jgi:hypothetical protein
MFAFVSVAALANACGGDDDDGGDTANDSANDDGSAGDGADDGSAGDDGDGGDGGGAGNVAACEAYVDSIDCGDVDLGSMVTCADYEAVTCDVSEYFNCLADNTVCTDGQLDLSGWANCTAPTCE